MVEFVDGIIGVLTANRKVLGEIADDKDSTMYGTIILLIGAFISGLTALFAGGGLDTLMSDILPSAILEILLVLIVAALFSLLLAYVLELNFFGGQATFIQSYRIFTYTSLWAIVGYIVLIIAELLAMLSEDLDFTGLPIDLVFSIIGIIVLGIGLSTFANITTVNAIIAAIVAYIIAFIVALVVYIVIGMFIMPIIFTDYSFTFLGMIYLV